MELLKVRAVSPIDCYSSAMALQVIVRMCEDFHGLLPNCGYLKENVPIGSDV